ncbi:hypothetical protein [Bosea sp. BH3]|uniref:hypothetical protein n=1 Tax=Bosea sp. BH3 TaxID=2871701 RepID=UPI0021CB337F|nr:hypothetical protein [Bosea sp. BH3]MCU4180418.1 hypothetical protein [Bosea sp. BH3]
MSTAAFALDRLRRLGDVVLRLRSTTGDSETLAALAQSLAYVIGSIYWEKRGDEAAGGLAEAGLTEGERAERRRFVDSVMADAARLTPSPDDVAFALRIAAADMYAVFDGSQLDFATDAARWNLLKPLWSRHGLSQWGERGFAGFIANVTVTACQAGDGSEAALLLSEIVDSLETAPINTAAMLPHTRNLLIETSAGIFYRFQMPERSSLSVDKLWQRLTLLPWVGTGGEDGAQRQRVQLAVAALRASLTSGSGDRPAMWRSLTQWCGQSSWSSADADKLEIGPLAYMILMETDHLALIRDSLGVLFVALQEPQQPADKHRLLRGIAAAVEEWLPAREPRGVAGALALAELLLKALDAESSNEPSALTGALVSLWLHLAWLGEVELVLSVIDKAWTAPATRRRPWLALAVLRATTALVGFPSVSSAHLELFADYARSAAFRGGIPYVGQAIVSLIDTLVDPSGAGLDPASFTYLPSRSHMDASAATTLDRKLAALLAARIAESGTAGDLASAKRDLDHLKIIAWRTPSTEAIGGFEAYMAMLDAVDPALSHLMADRDKIAQEVEQRAALGRTKVAIAADINDPLLFPYLTSPPIAETPPPRSELGSAAWPFQPLYSGSWHEVEDAAEAESLMSRLERAMSTRPFFQSIRQRPMRAIRTHQPRCYEAATVVEVLLGGRSDETEARSALFMLGKTVAFPIEGNARRVHLFNQAEKVLLERPEQAADYARFFCGVVQGEAGPFMLAESIGDLDQSWSPERPTNIADIVKQIGPVVPMPVSGVAGRPEITWQINATVRYDKGLFSAVFTVAPDGKIYMDSDDPLTSGVLDRVPMIRDGLRGWFHDRGST